MRLLYQFGSRVSTRYASCSSRSGQCLLVEMDQIRAAATRIRQISERLLIAAKIDGAKAATISLEQILHGTELPPDQNRGES